MKTNSRGGFVRLIGCCVVIGLIALVAWMVLSRKASGGSSPAQAAKAAVPVAGTFQRPQSLSADTVAPPSSAPVRPTPRVPAPGAGVSGPASTINGQKVAYSGAFARASVTTEGKTYDLTPNQMGYFGRIDVGPKSTTPVRVAFPQGNAGDVVDVVVEDGGHLDKDQMAQAATLDEAKTIAFDFTTTDQGGIYRIALRDGADVKVLNFWVGQEPQPRN